VANVQAAVHITAGASMNLAIGLDLDFGENLDTSTIHIEVITVYKFDTKWSYFALLDRTTLTVIFLSFRYTSTFGN